MKTAKLLRDVVILPSENSGETLIASLEHFSEDFRAERDQPLRRLEDYTPGGDRTV